MHFQRFYHLTTLVEDLSQAEAFYHRIFSPHCFMRGYAPVPLHRDAALLAIADTVIEPMQPHPPEPGQQATTIYRFLERYGPRVHSLAFLVHGHAELAARFEKAGVRWTDGGMPNHVFPHPKDFPGLLELADFGAELEHFPLADPRLRPQYDLAYWRDAHPLGIRYTSHYLIVVHDHEQAAERWVQLLDAVRLPDQPSSVPGSCSTYVLAGDGSVIELVQPVDATCPFGDDLSAIGETWEGVAFRVRDAGAAAAYLERQGAPIAVADDHAVVLDRAQTFGVHHAFTERPLIGDPRASRER